MRDFESCRVKSIHDFHIYNAFYCTTNFDFELFFGQMEKRQLLEFYITPNQVVIVYTGEAPDVYHAQIAVKIKNWINKINNSNINLKILEIDCTTGCEQKMLTPILRYNTKTVTKEMMDIVEIIYRNAEKYAKDGLYIEPIENLYNEVIIEDDVEEKNETLIGMTMAEFKKKFENTKEKTR